VTIEETPLNPELSQDDLTLAADTPAALASPEQSAAAEASAEAAAEASAKNQQIQAALEAIIYAADEPATVDQIAKALGLEKAQAREALEQLTAAYQSDTCGIEVRKVAGGWKFYTKAQHHDVVRKFIKSLQPPLRLTMPALETLAVIAYKQPVTVPEINEIRGVHVGGVIKTLLEKKLITTAGRKEVIGRPILYRTSKQFMMRFGLSDLDELPSLKEFEALAQAALGADEGIAEVQPEDVQAGDGEVNVVSASNIVTDEEAMIELEGNAEQEGEFSDATLDRSADAAGETLKDTIEDISGEQEAESESVSNPAQIAAEVFTDEQGTIEAPDKSRAATATGSLKDGSS
jgi:segregation and condensation protein B